MYTLIEYLEETHSSKNLLEMFKKHSLLLIVKCRTKTLFSHDFWLLLSIPYVCWSVSNCPQSWIDFFVVPPHYFSMLLTIGDLNNAQIICFHFPPPPPPAEKCLRIFTSSWPFAQTCLQFKKCHGSTIFWRFLLRNKIVFQFAGNLSKKWTVMPHNVPNMQLIFCNNYCV